MAFLTLRDVPGPTGLGSHWEMFRRRLHLGDFLSELSQRHGDVARFPSLGQPGILLSHPDDIHEVLAVKGQYFGLFGQSLLGRLIPWGVLATEGVVHDENRSMMLLALRKILSRRIPELTLQRCQQHLETLPEDQTLDVYELTRQITLSIAASLLFPRDLQDTLADKIDHGSFLRLVSSRTAYLLGLPKPVRVAYLMASLPSTVRTVITRGKIKKQLLEAIAEVRGRSTTGPHADALSLLLDGTEVGGSMPDEFLADNMMSLLLAAYETTANALAWAIWESIQREDLQQHLAHEGSGLSDDPRANESWINSAHWTDAVVQEALRMYPSVWLLPRQALAPFRLRNYLFPTGTTFSVSQWVTHRDARWFPDPHRFRPERWMEEREAATSGELGGKEAPAERPQFAYFPFGGGKRFCIGKAIFEYEASILVGSFFRRWRAEPVEGCQPRPLFLVTMQPDRPMRVRLRRR